MNNIYDNSSKQKDKADGVGNVLKKVIDAEFNDIYEAWRSGKYDRIVIPKGDGFFNAGISDISDKRVPKLKEYLESKI